MLGIQYIYSAFENINKYHLMNQLEYCTLPNDNILVSVFMELKRGIYQHYKGQFYQVLHVATHSETEEKLVVYQCLYGDYSIWVRPLSMFIEVVTLEDDRELERFKFIQPV